MATIAERRHQMIRRAVTQPGDVVEISISLWNRLSVDLISIIGEVGFQSLFSRSIHLSKANFPWIVQAGALQRTDFRFADLKRGLTERDVLEASEASIYRSK